MMLAGMGETSTLMAHSAGLPSRNAWQGGRGKGVARGWLQAMDETRTTTLADSTESTESMPAISSML